MKYYYVYILSSRSRTLYIGVTNDLTRRVLEHKSKQIPGFTAKYNIDRLVYFEEHPSINDAIAREKQLKGWLRKRKVALIESTNPTWEDLCVTHGLSAQNDSVPRLGIKHGASK
ncbi:MAG: GIY-YIG nuclease family protein [Armatimonadetes bacterium]|nr:GIY-YIG nuclease family protein [Armatimonadota bacterium]